MALKATTETFTTRAKESSTTHSRLPQMLVSSYTQTTSLVMAAILLFKCHSLGLQAQSDAAREIFTIMVIRGSISISQGRKGGSFSTLFKQPAIGEQQFCVPP
jgi:hypothetical protein